jgi:two-component system sensor histidine kinase/response regulator
MGSLPIIAITANVLAAEKLACLEAGMNDHIAKPLDLDVLVETILKHCDIQKENYSSVVEMPSSISNISANHVIELDFALLRLGGNKQLFTNVAERYLKDSATMASELKNCPHEGLQSKALALLHTLKGIAGTVGAEILADKVAKMEMQIRSTGSLADAQRSMYELSERIAESNSSLTEIIHQFRSDSKIGGGVSGASKATTRESIVPMTLRTMLDEIEILLAESDMRAVDVFDEIQQHFGDALGTRLAPLTIAINQLDFGSALVDC